MRDVRPLSWGGPGVGAGPKGAVPVRSLPRRRSRAVLAAWHGRCSGSRFPWAPLESSSSYSLRFRRFAGGSDPAPVRFPRPSPRCRTQGRELGNTGPHTRAESCPCVRWVFRKSGSLCAYPGGRSGTRPRRAWPCGVPGPSCARSGHSPGRNTGARRAWTRVVGIVRGASTPRGGYNARQCQHHASVPTTRVGADNARRRRGWCPSSVLVTAVSAEGDGRAGCSAWAGPSAQRGLATAWAGPGTPRGLFSVGRSRYAARTVQRALARRRTSVPVTHPPGHSSRAPAAWGRASRARVRVSASSGRSSR